jgi:hypothetical protein
MTIVIATVFALFSCGENRKIMSAVPNHQQFEVIADTVITESLFEEKDRSISEENIQRLLNGKLVLPDTIRIAVHRFAKSSINRYYYNDWTDEDFLKTQQAFIDVITNSLSKSSRVKKVVLIPSLMMNTKPTITKLRESAVRLQCDLLLVFTITSDIYYKYKMFSKDEAKAYATTEAMLLDTRTGLIPYSYVATRDYFSKKSDQDMNLSELQKRVEREAVVQSLEESGQKMRNFLEEKN